MKDRTLDEFQSMFQKAVVPTLEIKEVPIRRILLVASFSPQNDHALSLGCQVAKRFSSEVKILFPLLPIKDSGPSEEERNEAEREVARLSKRLEESGISCASTVAPGDPQDLLAEEVSASNPDLVVVASPIVPHPSLSLLKELNAATEHLLVSTNIPTLLVKNDRIPADECFSRVLVVLSGTVRALESYSLAFTLASKEAHCTIANVITQELMEIHREALEITTEIHTDQGTKALLAAVQKKLGQALKRLQEALHDRQMSLDGEVIFDDPVDATKKLIASSGHTLVVVRPLPGIRASRMNTAFALAHAIDEVPVLSL